jgi:hypothetical protein
VLDGVRAVQAGLLEELLKVVCRRPHLALAMACGCCNIPHAGAACFLIVAAIVVDHSRNTPRTLVAPFLATLDTLLGIKDSDVNRILLATTRGCLPDAHGMVKFGRLIVAGLLGGDAAQVFSGVPKNVA